MNQKTLQTLEFPKILARLAKYTSFPAGRELALGLLPSPDRQEVTRRLRITTEARLFLELKPGTSLGGVRDLRPLLERARIASVLEPQELLDILNTLRAGRRLCQSIVRLAGRFPALAQIASGFQDCPTLEREIARCITDRAELADTASPILKRIRNELRVAHQHLLTRLQELVSSPALSDILQEPIITQRNERYVLPIKAAARSHFPGIVHDQSDSGATLFMEPLALVDLQNHWRRLQLEEKQETERILRHLTGLVAAHAADLQADIVALAELDLAFAKAHYGAALRGIEPLLVPETASSAASPLPTGAQADVPHGQQEATPLPQGWVLELRQARHPLLDPAAVVPITVILGGDYRILVITGPNTGGKTVSLKTVGLLCLMAQAGLHIPAAEGSRIPVFTGIYADIGDEQSIEQSLSTFSGHMRNIIDILQLANSRSLVLLDELGAGTDPVEGSALARALLDSLLNKGCLTMVATHYAELKAYAQVTPGVRNASVEFDIETLSPTYRLSIGLPGQSNALIIAERLGLPGEIIARARSFLSPAYLQAEQLLAEIQKDREKAAADRQAAEAARAQAEAWQQQLAERLRNIEEERNRILTEARWEAEVELETFRRRLRRLLQQIEVAPQSQAIEAAWQQARYMAQELPTPPPPAKTGLSSEGQPTLAVGQTVWVRSLGQSGVIASLPNDRGQVQVQVGHFKVWLPLTDLEIGGQRPEEQRGESLRIARPEQAVSLQLDLRGYRAEEVPPVLERYLNDAYLAGLPYVRIIHGKGTGVLRQVVQDILDGHALVKEFRLADQKEGGEGATIVVLAD